MKLLVSVALLIVVAACTPIDAPANKFGNDQTSQNSTTLNGEVMLLPDGTKYLIHPSQLLGGGPAKDGIPSIDHPQFVTVSEADEWLSDDELGAAIVHKGVQRFYPFQILVYHEIVNDEVAGDAVMITYCPLCGSVIGYNRSIDGSAVEFGTSGKLYNSNLVMYDRTTDSYWTQIEGRAIIGPMTGKELQLFPVDVLTWADWKSAYPASEVLSKQTGFRRAYGSDPYEGYYDKTGLYFPVANEDGRLFQKAVVFGIVFNGTAKAYPESNLKKGASFDDLVGSTLVAVNRDKVGMVNISNKETGARIPHERDFWFAWAAFHPDTLLYEG
jgi:hypothetical protein